MGTQASKLLNHGIGTGGLMSYFGTGADGDLITGATFTPSSNLTAVVKNYNSINLPSGQTITVDTPCQGLVLYSLGDVVINGTIDMSSKASYCAGEIYSIPVLKANLPKYGYLMYNLLTLAGGAGGAGGKGGNALSNYTNGSGGNGGTGSKGRICAGGYGGGGGGGGLTVGNSTSRAYSNGTIGGSFSSLLRCPTVGGKIISADSSDTGSADWKAEQWTSSRVTSGMGGIGASAQIYNGNGRHGVYPFGGECFGAGGGGGAGSLDLTASCKGLDGGYSGGCIIIIAKGNITIGSTGIIKANGGNGGSGGSHPSTAYYSVTCGAGGGGGAGGAGGGTIALLYHGSYSNSGSITVNGGIGGNGGSPSYLSDAVTATGEFGVSGSSGSVGSIYTAKI